MLFFVIIKVEMPIIVGILTLMSMKNPCSAELSMKKNYNLGALLLCNEEILVFKST